MVPKGASQSHSQLTPCFAYERIGDESTSATDSCHPRGRGRRNAGILMKEYSVHWKDSKLISTHF